MATTESMRDNATAEENEGYEVQDVITQRSPCHPLLVEPQEEEEVGSRSFQQQQQEEEEQEIQDQNDTSRVEVNEDVKKRHLKLFRAAVSGDWGTAEDIFKKNPEDIRARISRNDETPLHIAVAANRTHFVEQMMKNEHRNADDLETKDRTQNTAFCHAALFGHLKLVNLMLKDRPNLSQIRGLDEMFPIQIAALFGHEQVVCCLYGDIKTSLQNEDRIKLLVTLIHKDMYDTALRLLKDYPDLATKRVGYSGETALHALARKPLTTSYLANPNQQGSQQSFFNLFSGTNMVDRRMHPKALELVESLWKEVMKLNVSHIVKHIEHPWKLIFVAAELGNFQFLCILFDSYPELIFKCNDKGHTIFHLAVLNRHERTFNLIHETAGLGKGAIGLLTDEEDNNILHLAAKLPPPNRLNIVSGPALQLQRELLWFKEVQEVVQPLETEAKNHDGKTPRALFIEEHEKLLEKGEEWMKKTAESCMIVATLIATVVFAAAFTVPGGVKEDTGSPNFLKKSSFIIFSIADPISLVSSSCSILTFLSILTARYAEEDFLWSLPTKLILGISTLFISIATMMVVFCVTLFILFNEGMQELAVLATALASIPVFLFLWQQYRLLRDVIRWTYKSNSLFHNREKMLFKQNDIPEGHSIWCGLV